MKETIDPSIEPGKDDDDSNVWTSNSDLFMVLAIVFLIMFVFTLLKSSVVTLKSKAQVKEIVEYQKGRIPKAKKDMIIEFKKNLEHGATKLVQNELVLENRLSQLSSFKQEITDYQGQVKTLIKEFDLQQAMLQSTKDEIEKKTTSLKTKENLIKEQATKVASLTDFNQKLKKETEVSKKESKKMVDQVGNLQQIYASNLKSQKQDLERAFKEERLALAQTIDQQVKDFEKVIVAKEQVFNNKKKKWMAETHVRIASLENNFSKKLAQQENQYIEKLNGQSRNFEKSIQEKEKTLLARLDRKQQVVEAREKEIESLINKINLRDFKVGDLSKQVAAANEQLKTGQKETQGIRSELEKQLGKVNELNSSSAGLQNELSDYKSKSKLAFEKIATLEKNIQDMLTKNQGLGAELAKKTGNISKLSGKNKLLQQKLQAVSQEASDFSGQAEKLGSQLNKLSEERGEYQKQVMMGQSKINGLKGTISGLQNRIEAVETQYQGQLVKLNNQLGQTRKKVASLSSTLQKKERKMKTLAKQLDKVAELKGKIGRKIAEQLKDAGILVQCDPNTGTITLSMDETFSFRNNSYQLSDDAKQKLQKLVPVYVQTLLGDLETQKLIRNIQVVGHASPRYKYKHFSPAEGTAEAYQYNMELSVNRAQQVTEFIFGKEMGPYVFRDKFKEYVQVTGQSFMNPIHVDVADVREACGDYDCARSRRVEISFQLRESMIIQKALENLKANNFFKGK